ncbi:hypothetical protein NGB36_19300 [Streptomyces sp. RB6PN25]|uniref:Bacterial Ig domain-containing protein n=1 Tax=Streptomyces humicola TaxID=2953240 RepID=A0ABT1PYE0_9ACTN|nr:hypothetical protein [Streptomyces humicola]MCQ4082693.1 hypothetical protein [Streptomyces humicola]
MNATKSSGSIRSVRAAAIGAVTAALLAAGALGASAAPSAGAAKKPSPYPSHMLPSSMPSSSSTPSSAMGYITIRATPATVASGKPVVFTGRTQGLKIGTKLTLQEMVKGKWVPLRATTTVTKGSSYKLNATLKAKGTQQLRVVGAMTASPSTTVVVH